MNTNNIKEQLNDLPDNFVPPSSELLDNLVIPKKEDAGEENRGEGESGEGTKLETKKDDSFIEPKKEEAKKEEELKTEEKKEEKKLEEEDDDTVLNILASEFGEIELDEEEATDDVQGVINYFKKREEVVMPEIKRQGIKELFQAMPVVEELVQHLSEGYGIESFRAQKQPLEFKEIDLDEVDETVLETVYRNSLKEKGTDSEEIDDLVETARDKGKLKERAKSGQDYLKSKYDEKVSVQKEKEKKENKEREESEKKITNTLKSFVTEGKIGNVKLNLEQAKKLENHLFGKDEDGVSLRDKRWSELSLEKVALLDYIIANDFKDLGLEENKSEKNTKRVIKIKKKEEETKKVDLRSNAAKLDLKSLFPQGEN